VEPIVSHHIQSPLPRGQRGLPAQREEQDRYTALLRYLALAWLEPKRSSCLTLRMVTFLLGIMLRKGRTDDTEDVVSNRDWFIFVVNGMKREVE
jgi:hypothetical protein